MTKLTAFKNTCVEIQQHFKYTCITELTTLTIIVNRQNNSDLNSTYSIIRINHN